LTTDVLALIKAQRKAGLFAGLSVFISDLRQTHAISDLVLIWPTISSTLEAAPRRRKKQDGCGIAGAEEVRPLYGLSHAAPTWRRAR
jgi:hypothetical protein